MAEILVVDGSVSIRETLRIVLGGAHEVHAITSFDERSPDALPDLVVLGLPPMPRDERMIGAALARAVPGIPLLLLHAASEVDVQALVPPHVAVEFLPKPFDAYTVRARVGALLRTPRLTTTARELPEVERRHLEFPFLSRAAAALVRRVVTADVRVLGLQGEVGTGAALVAHALHRACGRRGPFVAVDAARLTSGELERRLAEADGPAEGTVYVGNLERAVDVVQAEVAALAERAAMPGDGAYLVAGYGEDLATAVAGGRFLAELAYRVTAVPIVLTPLRDRPEDVPALTELLTRDLCARLRLESVRYQPAALERLQQYLWFGNAVELEAVIARTLVLHRPSVVDADQVLFLPEDAPRAIDERAAHPVPAPTATPSGNGLAGLDLEVVLGELAHELRNPMVTIKTFAQHLDSVLADPDVRARFAALTTEAIGRMDGLLETLLDFSRFRAPLKQTVALQPLLDRALGEHESELSRRHVDVERNGAGSPSVEADEAQVLFAFRSLCRGLVSDLTPHTILKVSGVERGLEMRVRTEPSTAARLAAWVEPGTRENGETPPLMWALAASLLERNGARLTVRKGDADATMIRIEWAPQRA